MGTKNRRTTTATVISRPNRQSTAKWNARKDAINAAKALDIALAAFRKEERVKGPSAGNTKTIVIAAGHLQAKLTKAGDTLDYLTAKAMTMKIKAVAAVKAQDAQIASANKRQAKKQEQRVQHANLIEARKSIQEGNEKADAGFASSLGAMLLQELELEQTSSGSYGKAHFDENGKKTTIIPVIK